jgi:hypothetical protein
MRKCVKYRNKYLWMKKKMNISGLNFSTNLVNSDRLSPQFNLIHNLTGVFGIFFSQELAKTVPLVGH